MKRHFKTDWRKRIFLAALSIVASQGVQAQCVSGNCEDGYGVYLESNGSRYEGFFENGDYEGFGTIVFSNGDSYIGNWSGGKFSGKGAYTWMNDGSKYIGHWQDGDRQGIGVTINADGTKQTNIWIQDQISDDEHSDDCINGDCKDGYGVAIYSDGSVYEGNFRNGYYDGQGIFTMTDGSKYEGEFYKGNFSGYGVFSYPDGTTKTGMWDRSRFAGEINPKNVNGCVSGDCDNGYGVYVNDNGDYYMGFFKDGKFHGQGKFITADGNIIRGAFENDLPHGYAMMRFHDDEVGVVTYSGDFKNGDFDGYGALRSEDGSVCFGQFKDGGLNGEAAYYEPQSGIVESGVYRNDELVEERDPKDFKLIYGDKNGFGIRLLAEGRYTGNLKGGIPEGQGQLRTYDGLTIVGNFRNGKANGQGMCENRLTKARYIGEFTDGSLTGNGTMYYADGTQESGYFKNGKLLNEKVADTKIAKPEVSWTTPQYYDTETIDSKMKIRLCVTSKTPLSEIVVTVNGKIQVKKALSRGFTVVTSDCDFPLEYDIVLEPGKNVIEAVVKNEGGSVTTDPRFVTLNKSDAVSNQKRLALVIGNADYQSITKLANPVNDANLMASTLEQLGFEVMKFTNMDRKSMQQCIYDFGDKLSTQGGVGLFYYAGHGLQVNGDNYLVPVSAVVQREQEVEDECVNLSKVLGAFSTSNVDLSILILDACRNNPFPKVSRAVGQNGGLAQVDAPKGTFVAYATAPGKTASDGSGSNGLYTEQLAKALKENPGKKIEDIFKVVRNEVYQKSKQMGTEQIPWENSSIFGDFYFKK